MSPIAHRVLARYLKADAMVDRIKAIPGYQRSNFLMSLLGQAQRGRQLSVKQLAVLDKIERESAPVRPSAYDVDYGPRGYFDQKGLDAIVRILMEKGVVRALDRKNILLKLDLKKHIPDQFEKYFAYRWEIYLERNADSDIPEEIKRDQELASRANEAADAASDVRVIIDRQGPIVTIKTQPTFEAIMRKYRIED